MALSLYNLGAACGTTTNMGACAGTTAQSSMSQFMSGGVLFDTDSITYYRNGTYTSIPVINQMYEWYINWNTGYGSRFYRIMDDNRGSANYSISATTGTSYVGINNAYWSSPHSRYRVNGQVNFTGSGSFTLQLTNSYEWNVSVIFAPETSGGGGGGGGQGGGGGE